jgi:aminopeptidase N
MVKFFSEKTGLKYPYAKYAQTTVRDFGGGMENISATTQTDNMIHDARTELDQTSDGLQSHELAHQWFGDYLTCRSWADIWLNESFATYFQAMWDEHKLGFDDFLYSDVKSNQDAYFNTWKQGNRRPIVTKNYVGPDAVFDTYAYPRGGAVLHMLRTTLGEGNWWRAINYYLRKYANQPVETEQFRIAIEESTGQSMDWFFDEWLYKMGHPIFRVTQNYDPAAKSLKLTIEQLQTIDPASQFPQVGMFQTPVEIEIGTASGTRVERVQILPQKEQSFTFSADSTPLLVNFDYRGTLIKELQFDKATGALEYQLNRDTDVLGRIWALQQLSLRMNMEASTEAEKKQITSEIGKALVGDKFWGVRLEAAIALANSKDSGSRDALISATKDPTARVRARAVTSLASTKDSSLAGLYQQFLNDPSYAVVRAAASALGETKSPVAYEALTKLLEVSSWRDNIKASALFGLRALQDKRSSDMAFRYAERGNLPQVRAAALRLLGSIGKDNPKSFNLISQTLSKAFERGDMTLGLASAEALVALGDPRGLAAFEQVRQSTSTNQQVVDMITGFRDRLQKAAVGAANPVVTKP